MVIFVLHQVIAEVGPSQSDFENIKFGGILGVDLANLTQIKHPSKKPQSLQGSGKKFYFNRRKVRISAGPSGSPGR